MRYVLLTLLAVLVVTSSLYADPTPITVSVNVNLTADNGLQVVSIDNLDVGGELYDATIQDQLSLNDLGAQAAITFTDEADAITAVDAIRDALNNLDISNPNDTLYTYFIRVPYLLMNADPSCSGAYTYCGAAFAGILASSTNPWLWTETTGGTSTNVVWQPGDDFVTFTDLGPDPNAPIPSPEPSSLMLLPFGLIGLTAYGWKRRRLV